MVQLVKYKNGLLKKGDAIATAPTTPECCCVDDPCTPCCIKIDFGTFDANGDLEVVYVNPGGYTDLTLTKTIIMPAKNNRKVCDGEEIIVRQTTTGTDATGLSWRPWIAWGNIWKDAAITPGVAVDGFFSKWGLADWGNSTATSVELSLTLDACWTDDVTQNSEIVMGTVDPATEDTVTITRCLPLIDCCPLPPQCKPCCFQITRANSGEQKHELGPGGELVYWVHGTDYDMRVTVTLSEVDMPEIVCDEGTVTVTAELVPVTPAAAASVSPDTEMQWASYKYGSHSPPVSGIDGTVPADLTTGSGTIYWGELVDTLGPYTLELIVDICDVGAPGDITIKMQPDQGAGGLELLELVLSFTICPGPDIEDCECPPPCLVHNWGACDWYDEFWTDPVDDIDLCPTPPNTGRNILKWVGWSYGDFVICERIDWFEICCCENDHENCGIPYDDIPVYSMSPGAAPLTELERVHPSPDCSGDPCPKISEYVEEDGCKECYDSTCTEHTYSRDIILNVDDVYVSGDEPPEVDIDGASDPKPEGGDGDCFDNAVFAGSKIIPADPLDPEDSDTGIMWYEMCCCEGHINASVGTSTCEEYGFDGGDAATEVAAFGGTSSGNTADCSGDDCWRTRDCNHCYG